MKKIGYLFAMFLFPLVSFAETSLDFSSLENTISDFSSVIGKLVPVVIGLAMLVFLWGVLRYVVAEGDPEKRSEARGFMIWGIVALAVMVSVWGLVKLLQGTLGLGSDSSAPTSPSIPK